MNSGAAGLGTHYHVLKHVMFWRSTFRSLRQINVMQVWKFPTIAQTHCTKHGYSSVSRPFTLLSS